MKTFLSGNKDKTHFVSAYFSLLDIHPQDPKLFWRSVFLTGKWMGVPAICKKFQCTICAEDKSILQCPDMNLVDSSFHNFLQILNILVIKSSYSINDIMLQSFYPLAVYALANDITSSIRTALGLANHEPKKTK